MSARELITEHLDLWTGAVRKKSNSGRGSHGKVELTGVEKLRELILELAIRGKLVEQDTSEEPAWKLLERIAREKKVSGKKGKKLPPLREDEKPFDIPAGWEVTRYGEIVAVTTGKLDANAADEGGKYPFFTCSRTPSAINTYAFDCEAVLLAGNGDFNLKYYQGKFNAYQRTYVIEPTHVSLKFLYYLTVSQIERITENNRGSAIRYLKLNDILMPFVYLPPLEEQHRIVQKVDELMALCDRLEQQTSDQLEAHETLVDTLLGTLTQSENATELADNWARLAAHFDTLFTTEQSIDKLKQAILQLAVMGRLVEQDAGDEPTMTLLQSIESHKAELIKSGVIKRSKPLPPVSQEEHPFKLPSGWRCHRLGELVSKLGSGSTPRGGQRAYVDKGVPFLRSQNIWNDGLRLEDIVYISEETHARMSNTVVYPKDILLNITGASLGRSTIFPDQIPEANVSQHVTIIRLIEPAMTSFVHLCIQSPLIQSLVWGRQVGMAIEGLSKKVLERFEMPIPPLEEQHRIVQKVDELMALCDQLKERINEASQTRNQLAEAVVEGALN